jgi:hypothetical protein
MEGQNLLKQGCVAPMFMCLFSVLFPMLAVPPIVSDIYCFCFSYETPTGSLFPTKWKKPRLVPVILYLKLQIKTQYIIGRYKQ